MPARGKDEGLKCWVWGWRHPKACQAWPAPPLLRFRWFTVRLALIGRGVMGSRPPPSPLPTPGLTHRAGRLEGWKARPCVPLGDREAASPEGQRVVLSSLPDILQVVRKGRALLAQKS